MLEPEYWGYVYIAESPNDIFELSPEEHIKYRQFAYQRDMEKAPVLGKQKVNDMRIAPPFFVLGEELTLLMIRHKFGYSIYLVGPFSVDTQSISDIVKFQILRQRTEGQPP